MLCLSMSKSEISKSAIGLVQWSICRMRPHALNSALTMLRTLQLWAFRSHILCIDLELVL